MEPIRIELVSGFDWASVVAPAAVLTAAILAFTIGARSVAAQNRHLDHLSQSNAAGQVATARAEWWRRMEWALARCISDTANERDLGLGLIVVLSGSASAGTQERELLTAFLDSSFYDLNALGDVGGDDDDGLNR